MPPTRTIQVAVAGIEATQATQSYRRRCHNAADPASDHQTVPLIAGKPLAVRVYPDVYGGRPPDGLCVDGELEFCPHGESGWHRADRYPGLVTAQPAAHIDRGDAQQTLNYRVPAEACSQTLTVRVRVWLSGGVSNSVNSNWFERTLTFINVRPLRLRAFGVHYVRDGFDLHPPTAAQLLHTLDFARRTYPVPDIEITAYDTLEFSGDLTDTSSSRYGRGWTELLVLLSRMRTADHSAVIHYAILPDGVPSHGYHGFGSPQGLCASFSGHGAAAAQEIGHALQLGHAPGGGAVNPDPNYPGYAGLQAGSIGQYGFDPVTGCVYSPMLCHDLMGYGEHHWVSPYTYRCLLKRLTRAPLLAPADGCEVSENDFGTISGESTPPVVLRLRTPGLRVTGQVCGDVLHLNWDVICDQQVSLVFDVRYTNNGGSDWTAISPGFEWNRCSVDLRRLPGGDDCRLQVRARTPENIAVSETVSFCVPRKRRQATIAVQKSEPSRPSVMQLFGAAHSPGSFADKDALVWTSSAQEPIGHGPRLTLYELAPGSHVFTLQAPDGLGGETRTQICVDVPATMPT